MLLLLLLLLMLLLLLLLLPQFGLPARPRLCCLEFLLLLFARLNRVGICDG